MKWGIRGIEEELAYAQLANKQRPSKARQLAEDQLRAKLEFIRECKEAVREAQEKREAIAPHIS